MAGLPWPRTRAQRLLTIAVTLVAGGTFGLWCGEDASAPLPLLPLVPGAAVLALVSALWSSPGASRRTGAALLVVAVLAAAWLLGRQSQRTAYNECQRDGAEILDRLHAHRQRKGTYPEALSELDGPVPCRRLLRGTLLDYERRGDGFVASYGDWLISASADEHSHAFRIAK